MQKWLLIIVGSVVFGLSLLAHLPAQLVLPGSSGKFQFAGISGTVWRGELGQILYSGQALPIQDLAWKANPLKLFTGKFAVDFNEQQAPANHGNISLNVLSRELELHGLQWQLPSRSLESLLLKSWVKTEGLMVLDLQSLRLPADQEYPSQLEGRLEWQNAALQLNTEYWLIGSPVVQFSDEGGYINGVVSNTQPMMPGNGSFDCTRTECLFRLDIQPTADAPQSMLSGLLLLGLQQNGARFSGEVTLPIYYP